MRDLSWGGVGTRNDVINVFMGDRRTLIPSVITHNFLVITVERIRFRI